MSLLEKCPRRSGMLVCKHAVNPSLEARSAPSMARTVYSLIIPPRRQTSEKACRQTRIRFSPTGTAF